MFAKFQNLFLAVVILALMPFMVGAETWTDPTCDPPACNTDGPVWVNPGTSQEGLMDLVFTGTGDDPIVTITDDRTGGTLTTGTMKIESSYAAPVIYAHNDKATAGGYAGYLDSDTNAALYLAGGLKFEGMGGNPGYTPEGLLYYNAASHLFKFYNGSSWVELSNQWTTNGDEIYRSFATSAISQGIGIKSGDATDPNDDYNLDVFRKALGTGDKGIYSRLEMVAPATDYVSGTLAGYEGVLPVGVIGKAEIANGIGVYGIGNQAAAYFSGEVGINDSDPSYDLDIVGDVLVDDGSGSYGVYIGNVSDAPGAQALYLLENGSNGLIRNYLDAGSLTLQGGSTASLSNQIVIAGGSSTDDIKFNNGGSTVSSITSTGDIYVGQASASDEDFIYFDSAGSESLKWDNTATRFEFSDEIYAASAGTGAVTNYGGYFEAAGNTGIAVYGHADYSSTDSTINYGGYFVADAGKGYGVYGEATSTAGYNATGGYFTSSATRGRGVQGYATDTSSTYTKYGGYFRAAGATDAGVFGQATSTDSSNYHYGVYGDAQVGHGVGIYGYAGSTGYSGFFDNAPLVVYNTSGFEAIDLSSIMNYANAGGELYVNGDIESDNNIYADRYYGNGSTSYYVDPNDTITSVTVAGDISLGRGSGTDNDYLYFDAGAHSLSYDEITDNRFEFNDDVYTVDSLSADENVYMGRNTGVTSSILGVGLNQISSSTWEYMRWENDSYDGNTLDNDERFYFTDNIYLLGTLTESSDRRLKENIKDIDSALKIVNKLEPVSFTWKEDGVDSYGFIAQDMYDVLPELVYNPGEDAAEDDYWGVDYAKMTSVLAAAIKEQQVQIEEQGKEIDELKKQIEYLMENIR